MSTSNVHQQSLADAGYETRPSMLERETRKWLNKAIDDGPNEFRVFTPSETESPKMQKEEDLRGDDLKHYEAEIEAMNLILISIPNDIYNSMDACTTAKAMWQRVERLMRGTVQNQLMNDLERNHIKFPPVTVNTKFLNCLQPEWLKYVTQLRLAKRLIVDSYDDLFDYLQPFEKLVNASRAKKLNKTHDPLALVAPTGSSSKTMTPYYVTRPSSVVDYDDDYQGDTVQNNYDDLLTSAMSLRACAITRNFSNPTNTRTAANVQCYNYSEKAKQDEAGVILTDKHNDFLFADASRTEEIEELSANICLIARIQPANIDSDAGPSYDSAFLSEVQTSSTSYVNPLLAENNL
ncbi:hypothetical protein Tco_0920385 [Tanacetum coccineum]